ncbi:MAG TPA: type II toxin-antitoxin system RatA family toxin [Pseudolabrys sp.]|nr:type II toxin-antitoxin system RatA family toxin [Pseudolabrys sp.]
MPRFSTKRRVRHAALQMFELVSDVEKYPEFVPLCSDLKVRSRSKNENGHTVLVADMTIAYKIIRETFTSRVTLDRENLRIFVEYLNGPFKRMQNRWTFSPIDDRVCDIEFFIEYEFRSRTLAVLMGAMFDTAFRRFAAAFEQRANAIYGRSPA